MLAAVAEHRKIILTILMEVEVDHRVLAAQEALTAPIQIRVMVTVMSGTLDLVEMADSDQVRITIPHQFTLMVLEVEVVGMVAAVAALLVMLATLELEVAEDLAILVTPYFSELNACTNIQRLNNKPCKCQ